MEKNENYSNLFWSVGVICELSEILYLEMNSTSDLIGQHVSKTI